MTSDYQCHKNNGIKFHKHSFTLNLIKIKIKKVQKGFNLKLN